MSSISEKDEIASLKAENARLKAEAEMAALKAEMARLAAENDALRRSQIDGGTNRSGNQSQDQSQNNAEERPNGKLIEFPICEEEELDSAFEEMLTECLQDDGKRDALRETYYEQPDQESKYYFFLEWASYLRKPEVMEQNSKEEQSVEFNGDVNGVRRRKGAASSSNSSDPSYSKYDKQRGLYRSDATRNRKSSPPGTIFQYFLLVMSISILLYALRFFLEWNGILGGSHNDQGGDLDGWD